MINFLVLLTIGSVGQDLQIAWILSAVQSSYTLNPNDLWIARLFGCTAVLSRLRMAHSENY